SNLSAGYPYFAQLMGEECIQIANKSGTNRVGREVIEKVRVETNSGKSVPDLEQEYRRAVGKSEDRKMLLTLLAEQDSDGASYDEGISNVILKNSRTTGQELGIKYIDQLLPRLIEDRYGPVLVRTDDQGVYEFADPVFRAYV